MSAINTPLPVKNSRTEHKRGKVGSPTGIRRPRWRHVMVAIDGSDISLQAISHGIAIANALGARLTLAHILEPSERRDSLTDPVEWYLRRQRARGRIEELAQQHASEIEHIETRIEDGRPGEQICRLARENQIDLTVMCMRGEGRTSDLGMGQTAQWVVDHAPGSVMLVPGSGGGHRHVQYRRIVVPLDGSSRAESALPVALRLTEAENAKIFLVHAVPRPELTETGPPEPEDKELRARVSKRNERVAQAYLGSVGARTSCPTASLKTLLLRDGDSRHLLMRAIGNENVDLVVMASHGHGGHADVAVGSVASHLLTHTTVPILLVRNRARTMSAGRAPQRPTYLTQSRFAAPLAV